MAESILARREKFAQALAKGAAPPAAWIEAGYTCDPRRARRRAGRPDIAGRVAEIARERVLTICDPIPVIEAAMSTALKASGMKTAAAMVAARGLLVEVARLQGILRAAPTVVAHEEPMTDEEWLAEFAPRKPESP